MVELPEAVELDVRVIYELYAALHPPRRFKARWRVTSAVMAALEAYEARYRLHADGFMTMYSPLLLGLPVDVREQVPGGIVLYCPASRPGGGSILLFHEAD